MKKIRESIKILLLEDNPYDAELIIKECQGISNQVVFTTTTDRKDFLKALELKSFTYSLVLADFNIPGYDAISAYRDMIKLGKDIPFILITGSLSDELAVRCLQEGMDDYILKDRISRLPDAITNVIKKKRLELEKKKAFMELEKNEMMLSEAQKTAKIGSWEVDMEIESMYWSDQMFRILGYKSNAFVPKVSKIHEHIHPEDISIFDELVGSARNGRKCEKYFRIITSKGKEKILHGICKLTRKKDKVTKLYGTLQDVTVPRKNEIALENLKDKLEHKVLQRTSELLKVSESLEQQNTMLTQSINYAKLIQRAHLSERKVLYNMLPESFILYEPRDVVSGDFYWFAEKNGCIVIAVGDCTGHGVPAALMTMVGISQLNTIIHDKGLTDPAQILNELHDAIRIAFKYDKEKKDLQIQDGMDIGICTYDLMSEKLFFAGARRPLCYIHNGKYELISPVRKSIGESFIDFELEYETVPLDLSKEGSFYIYSDGYQDQFGGKQNRRYTHRRFLELLARNAHLTMIDQKKILKNEFKEWMSDERQIDDVALLGFKLNHQ